MILFSFKQTLQLVICNSAGRSHLTVNRPYRPRNGPTFAHSFFKYLFQSCCDTIQYNYTGKMMNESFVLLLFIS